MYSPTSTPKKEAIAKLIKTIDTDNTLRKGTDKGPADYYFENAVLIIHELIVK